MQIVDNKAIVVRSRDPAKITGVIPKSKLLSNSRVLIHWGLEEMQVLRNLGIKNVPSPIMRDYDWPGQYTPFDHQKVTAAFFTLHRRAFCFNEQGTGKSASAIWAADYLMGLGVVGRVLVVCPLSIMDSAWRADLFKAAMHRRVDIAHGNAKKRKAVIEGDTEFVVTNYDTLTNSNAELLYGGFDLIIVDEASGLQNAQTQRWKSLKKLVGPDTWLWMMTGTPAAQSPDQAYGIAKLVSPNLVPKFYTAFKDMVMFKLTAFKWVPRPDASTTVHRVLQPAIRFTKEECLDLPEMMYVKRRVELTAQQRKYYDQMKKQMVIEAAGEEVTSVNAAVKLSRLLQIACGAVYTDSGDTIRFDITSRYKVLREAIDESSQKVLVFVPFKHAIHLIHEKLNADGVTAEIINGDVSASKRTDIFNRFQTEEHPRVLVIQPQAAAHGVTLTAANTVVWWGPVPSLETYAQANARVHRAGQHHPCTVVQLFGSDAEIHVYALLDSKMSVHTKVIDLYKKVLE